jgi:hypothetical protein
VSTETPTVSKHNKTLKHPTNSSDQLHYLSTNMASADTPNQQIEDSSATQPESQHWMDLLQLLPFSEYIFVSGSAATWMAERAEFDCIPDWIPNDIDVFVCYSEKMFQSFVTAWLIRNKYIGVAVRRRLGMVDVTLPCYPNLSFVRCNEHWRASDVIQHFDIDICTPIINRRNGGIYVEMSPAVEANIRERKMHCAVRNPKFISKQYPFMRTLNRLQKYKTRGYAFMSMTFHSAIHPDFPECDVELRPEDFKALLSQ